MKKSVFLKITGLSLLAFIIYSCGPAASSKQVTDITTFAQAPPSDIIEKPSWKESWQNTIDQAKKEARLLGYSSLGSEVRIALSEAFKKNFGIEIDWVAGNSGAVSQKLLTERRNGIYLADFYVGGSTEPVVSFKPQNALDSIESILVPEIIELEKWPEKKIPYLDKDHKIVGFVYMVGAPVLINTGLVKKGELKTYHDMLNPRWKGKIVMYDPTIGGKWFYVVGVKQLGLDFFRELIKQEPGILRDQRIQAEWIARGKYSIATTPKISVVVEMLAAGAPIEEINVEPEYGTTSGGNIVLINRAPHPGAAKLFINWLLTREGQTIFTNVNSSPSRRLDVQPVAPSPARIIKPGRFYFPADSEEITIEAEDKGREIARELFAPLIK